MKRKTATIAVILAGAAALVAPSPSLAVTDPITTGYGPGCKGKVTRDFKDGTAFMIASVGNPSCRVQATISYLFRIGPLFPWVGDRVTSNVASTVGAATRYKTILVGQSTPVWIVTISIPSLPVPPKDSIYRGW